MKNLFFSMFKVGCIGFGGGSALIPIIQKEAVEEQNALNPEEYEEDVLIGSITPGALTVKIAGGIGRRIAGGQGMFIGAAGMGVPGVLLTIAILSFMTNLSQGMIKQVDFVTVGIMAYITCMLTDYIITTFQKSSDSTQKRKYIVVTSLVFILTCEKNLYRLLEINRTPVFALSTLDIFLVAFLVLFVVSIIRNYKKTSRKDTYNMKKETILQRLKWKELISELWILFLFMLIAFIPAYVITEQTIEYIGKGFLSALLSFGGGDAYLTVADGFFVNTGLISEDLFYGSIVPVVNILPGSVLCKMLSGIGYYLGLECSGTIWGGYVVALAGFFCSLAASCGVVSIVGCIYRGFGEMPIFSLIKKWIRPIVSGLMMNVILALIYHNRKVGVELDMGWMPVGIMFVIYGFNVFLYYRKKTDTIKMVSMSILLSWALCNLWTWI